jgi:hypothetical protein
MAVAPETVDDVQVSTGGRCRAEPRVAEHDGGTDGPGRTRRALEAEPVGQEVEAAARADLEQPDGERADRLEVPERPEERRGASDLVGLGRARERRGELVDVSAE